MSKPNQLALHYPSDYISGQQIELTSHAEVAIASMPCFLASSTPKVVVPVQEIIYSTSAMPLVYAAGECQSARL